MTVISTEERRLWRQAGLDSGPGTTAWPASPPASDSSPPGCGLTDYGIGRYRNNSSGEGHNGEN